MDCQPQLSRPRTAGLWLRTRPAQATDLQPQRDDGRQTRTMEEYPRFDLSGRTALVTAAGRGLGRAISLALADAGADVVLGLRDATSHADLGNTIEGMGRRCLAVQMDMSDLRQ